MPSLSRKNKTECQVIFILLAVSLLLEQVSKEADEESEQNPAIKQCSAMIDELLKRNDEDIRNAMIKRINVHRTKFTKKVSDISLPSGLIGSLRYLTGGKIKTKPGTRLDYIVSTFRTNLKNMEEHITFREDHAEQFYNRLKETVNKIR